MIFYYSIIFIEIGCTHKEALSIITAIRTDTDNEKTESYNTNSPLESNIINNSYNSFNAKTAYDLMNEQTSFPHIVTFNQDVDNMLGGGISIGKITELCGIPGIGKTQMGMQLAVNTHIPEILGGVDGHCIYVDTEGSLMPERVGEIATSLVQHVQDASTEKLDYFNVDYILDHIYCYRIHDYIEQIALLGQLKQIILDLNETNQKPIRLVVIDSITFHFRSLEQFKDMSHRTKLLTMISSQLMEIALMNVAVVLINQVTSKPGIGFIPALGETWGHLVTMRILLDRDQSTNMRKATLIKSSEHKYSTALYQVTAEGIR